MSRDPERLLAAQSGADELERELLRSLQAERAPASAKTAGWTALSGQIAGLGAAAAIGTASSAAAAGASSGTGSAAAAKVGIAALAIKGAAVTAAVGGLALGGYLAARPPRAPSASHPQRTAQTAVPADRSQASAEAVVQTTAEVTAVAAPAVPAD